MDTATTAARRRPQRSNGQVLTAHRRGDVIPSAVQPPHDQRAHSLPQDLKGQMRRVLTRQPLPEPSCLNRLTEPIRRGLPLERVYRCLFNPDLYLLAYG